ncbi:MAG: hypothetical protein EOO81_09775 [Oxalobacteraceae bacterium]|nr:MAG: hypothetical protein EOO81_09775 [Oxalobacteraceae bacterium]
MGVAFGWCTGGTFASGPGDGALAAPYGLTVNRAADRLYIVEQGNSRITRVAASTGAYLGSIGVLMGSTGTCPSTGGAAGWCTGGTFVGSGADGGFSDPRAVVGDNAGNLYVGDQSANRVVRISEADGAFKGAIGYVTSSTGTCLPGATSASGWCTGGTFGSTQADGSFPTVNGLAIDTASTTLFTLQILPPLIQRLK